MRKWQEALRSKAALFGPLSNIFDFRDYGSVR